jgi:hypothetical protein
MPKCKDCTFVVYLAESPMRRQSAWFCVNEKCPVYKSHGPLEYFAVKSGESFCPLFEKREVV